MLPAASATAPDKSESTTVSPSLQPLTGTEYTRFGAVPVGPVGVPTVQPAPETVKSPLVTEARVSDDETVK